MGEIIQFPLSKDPDEETKALRWVHESYVKIGLSAEDATAAVAEFRPYLDQFSTRLEASLELPPDINLNSKQRAAWKSR